MKKHIISFVGNTLSARLGELLSSSYLLGMSEEDLNQKSPEINSLNQIIRYEATDGFYVYCCQQKLKKCTNAEILREFLFE